MYASTYPYIYISTDPIIVGMHAGMTNLHMMHMCLHADADAEYRQ